jgi:hypothetical protein
VAISPHLRTGVLTRDPSAFEPVVGVAGKAGKAGRTRGTHKLCGVADSRERRQLELIHEFASLAGEAGVEWWLRGGWALDFLLGRVTRAHEDIDVFIWAADAPRLLPRLKDKGYEEIGGPPPEQQRNLVKDGEEFHVTLIEENELGVVTAGGRWANLPWTKGMLDGPIGQIGDIRCRVISPEAQLWAKEEAPHALAHAPRDRDHADIALLRQALAAETRRQGQ